MSYFEKLREVGLEDGTLCVGMCSDGLFVARLQTACETYGSIGYTEADTVNELICLASDPEGYIEDHSNEKTLARRVLKATLDELGFDETVSLLERLDGQY